METITYDNITYEVLARTELKSGYASHAILVKRPKGRRTYHGLEWTNGRIWVAA